MFLFVLCIIGASVVDFYRLYFNGGTLSINRWPLVVLVVCPLGLLVNNFMLDQTTSSSMMYFSVSFDGSIVTI